MTLNGRAAISSSPVVRSQGDKFGEGKLLKFTEGCRRGGEGVMDLGPHEASHI